MFVLQLTIFNALEHLKQCNKLVHVEKHFKVSWSNEAVHLLATATLLPPIIDNGVATTRSPVLFVGYGPS
jgi:hypothetical protein